MIIAIKSLLGFVGDLSHLSIDRMLFGTVSILSIVGMMIGNKIQHTIDDQLLKQ